MAAEDGQVGAGPEVERDAGYGSVRPGFEISAGIAVSAATGGRRGDPEAGERPALRRTASEAKTERAPREAQHAPSRAGSLTDWPPKADTQRAALP